MAMGPVAAAVAADAADCARCMVHWLVRVVPHPALCAAFSPRAARAGRREIVFWGDFPRVALDRPPGTAKLTLGYKYVAPMAL